MQFQMLKGLAPGQTPGNGRRGAWGSQNHEAAQSFGHSFRSPLLWEHGSCGQGILWESQHQTVGRGTLLFPGVTLD